MRKNITLSLLLSILLIWAFSYPINKIALDYTPPMLYAGLRTLLGGLMLVPLYWHTRHRIQWRKNWKVYVWSALLNIILFYAFQTFGLLYLPSGLFSVIVYIQPVLVGILAWQMLKEPMHATKAVGLLLGFASVAAISLEGFTVGSLNVLGVLFALATALSWALGAVYIKKYGGLVDSIWLVAIQSIMGGTVLTLGGTLTESWGDIIWNWTFIAALTFGIVFGLAISWIVYFILIKQMGASEIAAYTFLVPLMAVAAGALMLDEALTADLLVGLVLIMISIWLVNRKPGIGRATKQTKNI
jgi:drug/metabolite transporter (DMT)-like permease